MGIHSIMGTAVQGIQQGLHGLRRVATEVTGSQSTKPANPTDLSRAMVEMQQHAHQAKASAKTLQSADEMLGTLFDEHA